MAYTAEQLADLLFKKVVAGKATSDSSKAFFEESLNSRKSVLAEDIWNQSGLIPTTAPTLAADGISGVVQYKENVPLVPIPGTNAFTTGITDIVPFNFGDGSYDYLLKDGLGNQIAPGSADWLLDSEAGLITFFDPGSTYNTIISTGTLTLTVYRYVGTKGAGGGSSSVSGSGFLLPAIDILDNVTFEALVGPIDKDRYLLSSTTNAVVTIYDENSGISTPNQIVSINSVLEYFDDSANGGTNAGWIIDFDGFSPSIGMYITILDEPGFLYQYHTGIWNQYSFERTLPSRAYKDLVSDAVIVDGGEMTLTSLPGGLTITPTADTYVEVSINGVQVSIQDTVTSLAAITAFCYFSDDGGLTSKDLSLLVTGDRLYWKPSISGYNLEILDRININFVSNQ